MSHYFGLTPGAHINTQTTTPTVAYPGNYFATVAPPVPNYVQQATATPNVAMLQAAAQPVAYAMPRGPTAAPTAYAQFPAMAAAPNLTALPSAEAAYYAGHSALPTAQYGAPPTMLTVGRPAATAAWPNSLSVAPPSTHLTGAPQLLHSNYTTPMVAHNPAVSIATSPYQIAAPSTGIAPVSNYNPALHQLQQSINAAANATASLQPMMGFSVAPQSQLHSQLQTESRGFPGISNAHLFQKPMAAPNPAPVTQLSSSLSSVMYQDANTGRYVTSNLVQNNNPDQTNADQPQSHKHYNNEPASTAQTYTGYEAALYSAATSYYQQQQIDKLKQNYPPSQNRSNNGAPADLKSVTQSRSYSQSVENNRGGRQYENNERGYWNKGSNNRDSYCKSSNHNPRHSTGGSSGLHRTNSDESIHYCDVCKISCAGLGTYREHLAGQNHIKRESAASRTVVEEMKQFECILCDVSCGGRDAYNMHIRSARHVKNVALKENSSVTNQQHSGDVLLTNQNRYPQTSQSRSSSSTNTAAIRKLMSSAPKINFFGKCTPASVKQSDLSSTLKQGSSTTDNVSNRSLLSSAAPGSSLNLPNPDLDSNSLMEPLDLDQPPIGAEYVQVLCQSKGESATPNKVVTYICKLCDCKFNDANSKEMHLRGRRHRLQYKKKVDPKIDVDSKLTAKNRKLDERQSSIGHFHEDWRRRIILDPRKEMFLMEWDNYGGAPASKGLPPPQNFMGGGVTLMMGPQGNLQKIESADDRHVKAKHWSISSTESERQAIAKFLSTVERSLKQSSSQLPLSEWQSSDSESISGSVLKGVDKIGVGAKGLVLHGDSLVEMVLHVGVVPTVTLLQKLSSILQEEMTKMCPDEVYTVSSDVTQCCLIIRSPNQEERPNKEEEFLLECHVTLTSHLLRSGAEAASDISKAPFPSSGASDTPPTSPQIDQLTKTNSEELLDDHPPFIPLNKEKCLQALARLRHAKWFQANGNKQENCLMIIRIFRDLCMRVPTWNPLKEWEMELLIVQSLNSVCSTVLSPGVALRRVFECVASGILINSKPGLRDPCEKEEMDAVGHLSTQEIEDITASAQHALRLIAFRQIHKVLDMEPLPPPDQPQNSMAKKRVLDSSACDDDDVNSDKKQKTSC